MSPHIIPRQDTDLARILPKLCFPSNIPKKTFFGDLKMLDDSRMKKAIELGHQATALDRDGKYSEALDVYKLSIEHFMLVWKYEQNPSFKQRLESKIDEYLKRAEQLKQHVDKKVYVIVKLYVRFLVTSRAGRPPITRRRSNG